MKRHLKPTNPFSDRLAAFAAKLRKRSLCAAIVCGEANQRGLVGFGCDNGRLCVSPEGETTFYTDFRYRPAARREAPWLKVRDIAAFGRAAVARCATGRFRIGFEGTVQAACYLAFRKMFRSAAFVDVEGDLLLLRAVKTPDEIVKVAAAAALNDRIWRTACRTIRPGMTEKEIQRLIRAEMNALGDGEAFEAIVCAGRNAAECHHVPDDTVWRKGEPLLVDMGVKLEGYCSDMTRCIGGRRGRGAARYAEIYEVVRAANLAAIAALKPGMSGRELDAVARRIIRKAGYGACFGHALGHGVGLEIHEWPVASRRSRTVLKPGMVVTVEPGIYIEGELGVRIEDLVLVSRDGCEVLSSSGK